MEETCRRLFALARPYLNVRGNQRHAEISYIFAKKLLAQLGGRPEIVLPAIVLHDVGWSAVPEELHLLAFGPGKIDEDLRRVHEVEGAKIAAELLGKVPLKKEDCREICGIIENHDSGQDPVSLEEKMVKDADKLYRFSREGFLLDSKRFSIGLIGNWERLACFLSSWFFTDYGKSLAAIELKKLKDEFIS